ncbi:MAG TPA: HD domain-containing protein [Polyangiaceae bacterium]|nr:HD domain-containing protein [Polyangiaceae bacterium]
MKHLLDRVPEDVRAICKQLNEASHQAYVVGGCVRDLLLGKDAADWDVTTDAKPEDVKKIFPRVIPTGIQHGTVTVLMKGKPYEVTTFRGEGAYSDGRRPDSVEFVNDIAADLARRDFTVNAIALDPNDGRVIDPYEGQKDISRKVIRAVGKPLERFLEDGLRVLRAARFTATLEFDLDPDTEKAIAPSLDVYKKVSQERVRDEWMKAMKARRPSRAFDVMRTSGILAITCPEMLEGVGMEQNKWHTYDVWKHGMECLDACAGGPILRIAAMLHDVGKPRSRAFSDKTKDWTFYDHERFGAEIADPICLRLRFSNDEREHIVHLVRNHLFHYTDEWNDATVRRFIKRIGIENLEDLYALNEADVRAKGRVEGPDLSALTALKAHVKKVIEEGAALTTRDLAIKGNDLMKELSLTPGPAIGKILNALLEEVIAEPKKNDRETLLALARKMST